MIGRAAAAVLAILGLNGILVPDAHAVSVPFQRGITVAEWGRDAYAREDVRRGFRRIRALNVDTITLVAVWRQASARSSVVAPTVDTVATPRLVAAIRYAKHLGLRVVLRPYVDVADGSWRGTIQPASLAQWFRSYTAFQRKYARVAAREDVDCLVMGTEMLSVSAHAGRWRSLAAELRRIYGGIVAYQANWDEATGITWWDAVDVIDISGYYPLAPTGLAVSYGNPLSVEQLTTGWQRPLAAVDALRRRFGKPVMFGEIGYRATLESAFAPWDTRTRGRPSGEAQADAYEAAFRAWYGVSWFRGFHWWRVPSDPTRIGRTLGSGHQPRARARSVLRRWYHSADRIHGPNAGPATGASSGSSARRPGSGEAVFHRVPG